MGVGEGGRAGRQRWRRAEDDRKALRSLLAICSLTQEYSCSGIGVRCSLILPGYNCHSSMIPQGKGREGGQRESPFCKQKSQFIGEGGACGVLACETCNMEMLPR